ILIGCIVGILSSACQSVGLILQRKAHLITQDTTTLQLDSSHLSPYKRSLWHIGFLLFIIANVFGSSIQITTLPLIILSPLQSIGLVFNTIFNSILLDEIFTMYSLIGTVLISLGAFLIAFFGGGISEPDYDLNKFILLLKQPGFITWIFINSILIAFFLSWILITNYEIHSRKKLITKINDLRFKIEQSALRHIQGFLYGLTSGILSAHSLLLAKSSIEILITTFINHELKNLNNFRTYALVISFLVLCLSQLYLLNQGLKHISTSILYPLIFCVYNIINIANDLIFYQQWNYVKGFTGFLIFFGTMLVISGVFVLSYKLE
ncbi:hypothetical protein CANARDRAFT_179434, partial [[Candida] arabinofermentans NRRL YB-2248]